MPWSKKLPDNYNPHDWKTFYQVWLPSNPEEPDELARGGRCDTVGMAKLAQYAAFHTDRNQAWVWMPYEEFVKEFLLATPPPPPTNAVVTPGTTISKENYNKLTKAYGEFTSTVNQILK